jgi:hypothetical protein
VAIEKDRERFLPQRSSTRCDPRKLVPTGAAAPPLFVPDLASFHHVLMRTFRTYGHATLPIILGIKRSRSMLKKGYLGNTLTPLFAYQKALTVERIVPSNTQIVFIVKRDNRPHDVRAVTTHRVVCIATIPVR